MNERIKELSNQAMKYATEQYGPQRSGESVWNPLTYETKLAELIVNECADFVEQDQGYGEALSNRLKKHFGIE